MGALKIWTGTEWAFSGSAASGGGGSGGTSGADPFYPATIPAEVPDALDDYFLEDSLANYELLNGSGLETFNFGPAGLEIHTTAKDWNRPIALLRPIPADESWEYVSESYLGGTFDVGCGTGIALANADNSQLWVVGTDWEGYPAHCRMMFVGTSRAYYNQRWGYIGRQFYHVRKTAYETRMGFSVDGMNSNEWIRIGFGDFVPAKVGIFLTPWSFSMNVGDGGYITGKYRFLRRIK